jgi:hypothetical protein
VRIADNHQAEHLQLAALGRHLVFGVHTDAQSLLLRPLRFMMRDVLPARPAGDTVVVRARFDPPNAVMAVSVGDAHRESNVRASLGDGWRLFFPRQTYVRPSSVNRAMHVAWLASLMFPAGYLAAFALARWPAVFVAGGTLTALGVVAVPALGGYGLSPVIDIVATLLGFLVGVAVSRAVALRIRSAAGALRQPGVNRPAPFAGHHEERDS